MQAGFGRLKLIRLIELPQVGVGEECGAKAVVDVDDDDAFAFKPRSGRENKARVATPGLRLAEFKALKGRETRVA